MTQTRSRRNDVLQGTLGLLVLRTLAAQGPLHGYAITSHIQRVSAELLRVEEGSLYPALRRLEDRGLVTSRWATTENNRRARFYALSRAGRAHLRADAGTWLHFAQAVTLVLRAEPSVI